MATPYLRLVQKTMAEILELDRPLTVDGITDFVEEWFKKTLDRKRFVTRAALNVMRNRKINAVLRVLKMIGSNVDVLMETTLRQKITNRLNQ